MLLFRMLVAGLVALCCAYSRGVVGAYESSSTASSSCPVLTDVETVVIGQLKLSEIHIRHNLKVSARNARFRQDRIFIGFNRCVDFERDRSVCLMLSVWQ